MNPEEVAERLAFVQGYGPDAIITVPRDDMIAILTLLLKLMDGYSFAQAPATDKD